MSQKPELPSGYLGAQPSFDKLGLSCLSHIDASFSSDTNQVEIKFKCKNPVKVTNQLICCRTEKEFNEYVFSQSLHGTVSFIVHMPESGFYKLQIFAVDAKDDTKSLPNVYNYLIECKKALNPVFPFPKQYAQWKDGCYLHEPLVLHTDGKLTNIQWKVIVPNAKAVAVVADGDWQHFEKKGNHWEANFSLDHLRGKKAKITLNACLGDDDTKFSTLLEYHI
ncbi:hypothetical protein CHS0354_021045 [Potamilus streckersoni]|uniref:KY-like immunoglobulin-like domain-containing protein n=1 Tax=Potamilus streckersoni TaxID=2493646 RepID=A0AAE0SDL2_9BIVA|nr:hypothetical protein CHS0354_021045 [Potamilus streckersoni]